MTRETVAGVVLASFATSEMVGWAKVLETITYDRDCVNARRDSVNVPRCPGGRARVQPDGGEPARVFASLRPWKGLTYMGLMRNLRDCRPTISSSGTWLRADRAAA